MGEPGRPRERQPRPLGTRWLIAQEGQVQVTVCEVAAINSKHFTMGIGLGFTDENGESRASQIGNLVLKRLFEHTSYDTQIYLVWFAHLERVGRRLAQTFAAAPSGASIMCWCKTPKILDAVSDYLPLTLPILERH